MHQLIQKMSEGYIINTKMTTITELQKKYLTNTAFQKQMKQAEQKYQLLQQRAGALSLTEQNSIFIDKFKGKTRIHIDIYFAYGMYQHIGSATLDKLTLNFIAKLPKPNQFYILVYFNDQQYSDAFSTLKTVLQTMPVEYFLNLIKVIVVKPSFAEKASRYFTFSTALKYINAQILDIETLKQLGNQLGTDTAQIVQALPFVVRKNFQEQIKLQNFCHAFGIKNNQTDKKNHTFLFQQFEKKLNSQVLLVPSKQKKPCRRFQIDEYTQTQNGIPQQMQVLVVYFKQNLKATQQQGIFRKSVSVAQQIAAIKDLSQKNYDKIKQIYNPHTIANLLKRFLRDLSTPVIPYNIFHKIMQQQNLTPSFICQKMKQLSAASMTKLLTLVFLLQFLVSDIIPRSNVNKMNEEGISICFAPCLMHSKEPSIHELQYARKSASALKIMINHFQQIFGSKNQRDKYRQSYLQIKKNSNSLTPLLLQSQTSSINQCLPSTMKTQKYQLSPNQFESTSKQNQIIKWKDWREVKQQCTTQGTKQSAIKTQKAKPSSSSSKIILKGIYPYGCQSVMRRSISNNKGSKNKVADQNLSSLMKKSTC